MMVYSVIDEAGADGIWNRTIKNKLNMHEAVVKNCIKYLETKGYIASMKNVEHPNKKMYIKANLRPSDRATGGPWFTDGELDITTRAIRFYEEQGLLAPERRGQERVFLN